MAQQVEVKRVKEMHKGDILAKPNVIGVGTGYKETSRGQDTESSAWWRWYAGRSPRPGWTLQHWCPRRSAGCRPM